MRSKVFSEKKAKSQSVSLFPNEWKFVNRQADTAGSRSKYLRMLVNYDRKHNLLPLVLKAELETRVGEI